jgi:hypothetical protein
VSASLFLFNRFFPSVIPLLESLIFSLTYHVAVHIVTVGDTVAGSINICQKFQPLVPKHRLFHKNRMATSVPKVKSKKCSETRECHLLTYTWITCNRKPASELRPDS